MYRQQNKKNKKIANKSKKILPAALDTGIGTLTDANNVSLGGDEGLTPIRDHVRVNTRHRHDRDLLEREKFKFESEVAIDIQNDADEYQASKAKLKYLTNKGNVRTTHS